MTDSSALMALGDGYNDLEMLKLAGTAVAMGNGVAAVKEVADYITERTNADGGWAEALRRFVLHRRHRL
jgi:hydroxymethylpyrimidine pyrophosphatase-like HAD family hydrolase